MSAQPAHYPWQSAQWQALSARIASGRLPHALLLSGPAGVGKLDFARYLAQSLLCEHAEGHQACGQCRSCQLFAAGTHPDFLQLQPEEAGKDITVGQVRALVEYQTLTPQYGRAKVVIIEPADRMNSNAANALLKTLEEPGRDTVLLLVSARPAVLLPTIRSRCQALTFPAQHGPEAVGWLSQQLDDSSSSQLLLTLSGGAPLRAVAMAQEGVLAQRTQLFTEFEQVLQGRQDPVAVAGRWMEWPLQDTLRTLYSWLADMVRLRAAGTVSQMENPDLRERLQAAAEQVDLVELVRRVEQVQELMRYVRGQLNVQMTLEDILLGWTSSRGATTSNTR